MYIVLTASAGNNKCLCASLVKPFVTHPNRFAYNLAKIINSVFSSDSPNIIDTKKSFMTSVTIQRCIDLGINYTSQIFGLSILSFLSPVLEVLHKLMGAGFFLGTNVLWKPLITKIPFRFWGDGLKLLPDFITLRDPSTNVGESVQFCHFLADLNLKISNVAVSSPSKLGYSCSHIGTWKNIPCSWYRYFRHLIE